MEHQDVIRLPFESSTPSIARTKLAAFLTVHRVPTVVLDNALIVLSEMIANAVSHGVPDEDGMMELGWSVDEGRVELMVRDRGGANGAPLSDVEDSFEPRPFDEDSLNGRGLSIISRVADRWSVDLSEGTRVRAELVLA